MSNEWFGWAGTILRVDLTERRVVKEPLPQNLAYHFLGGRNINSKLLFDEVPAGADPLGPENKLIIGAGPLVGTLGLPSSRFTVTAKSPLTGILGDGNAGSDFAPELKFAGYDHIVVSGKAKTPVYIWIDDDRVEIRDASHLWGKDVFETEGILRQDVADPEIETLTIGPAGENLVAFAIPMASLFRAPGRCGTGAVMGSKNLKSIAVRGSKSIKVARPKEYIEYAQQLFSEIYNGPMYPTWSTVGSMLLAKAKQQRGELCVRNFQATHWSEEKARELYGEVFLKDFAIKSKGCFGCPIHCSHGYVVKDGPYAGAYGEGLDWGVPHSLACALDNPKLDSVCEMNVLLSKYGMDGMSSGLMIAFAIELFEKEILTTKDTDGMVLDWGDDRLFAELLRKMAYREGFGDFLAMGKREIVKRLGGEKGKEAEKYASHIKWLDSPTDFRGDVARALNFAVATRGADHLRGLPVAGLWVESEFKKQFEVKDQAEIFRSQKAMDFTSYDPIKADLVIYSEHICSAADALGVCKFGTEWVANPPSVNVAALAKLASLVTGLDLDANRLNEISDRGLMVERAFCAREGITAEQDMPPSGRSWEPIPSGPQKGRQLKPEQFRSLLRAYYEKRGWDPETGIPTAKKLEELGLAEVAAELSKLGLDKKTPPAKSTHNTPSGSDAK